MAEEKQENILKGLQNLLEEQIKLTRGGNYDSVRLDQLNKQADVLVRRIAQTKLLQQDGFKGQKEKLRKTYDDLYLAIKAEQKQIAENLNKIRKGKKTISVYQKNI
jgi:hypothetical protein